MCQNRPHFSRVQISKGFQLSSVLERAWRGLANVGYVHLATGCAESIMRTFWCKKYSMPGNGIRNHFCLSVFKHRSPFFRLVCVIQALVWTSQNLILIHSVHKLEEHVKVTAANIDLVKILNSETRWVNRFYALQIVHVTFMIMKQILVGPEPHRPPHEEVQHRREVLLRVEEAGVGRVHGHGRIPDASIKMCELCSYHSANIKKAIGYALTVVINHLR